MSSLRKLRFRAERQEQILRHWSEFVLAYPDEEACWSRFFAMSETDHTVCQACKRGKVGIQKFTRFGRCNLCRRKTWFTAGSFFNKVNALRPWFATIWFLERGLMINACELENLVSVCRTSAQNMLKKISFVINEQLLEFDQIDESGSAAYLELFCKRSSETPARCHPSKEEHSFPEHGHDADTANTSELEEMLLHQARSLENKFEVVENAKLIFECLPLREPIEIEELQSKSKLEDWDMFYKSFLILQCCGASSLNGVQCRRTLVQTSSAGAVFCTRNESIDLCIRTIKQIFSGISRKYLESFLALYSCHRVPDRLGNTKLLKACISYREVSFREIRNWVAAGAVKIY